MWDRREVAAGEAGVPGVLGALLVGAQQLGFLGAEVPCNRTEPSMSAVTAGSGRPDGGLDIAGRRGSVGRICAWIWRKPHTPWSLGSYPFFFFFLGGVPCV